jgi:hypothetical protein
VCAPCEGLLPVSVCCVCSPRRESSPQRGVIPALPLRTQCSGPVPRRDWGLKKGLQISLRRDLSFSDCALVTTIH